MKRFKEIVMVLLGAGMFSCSSTDPMTIGVTQPAPVTLSPEVATVGILDRSDPVAKNAPLDQIDRIFSVEGKNLDKEGAQGAVRGLTDELINLKRFHEVKVIDGYDLRSPGMGVLPSTLDWATVESLCNENGVDVLYALELFDTDTRVDYKTNMLNGPLGVPIPEHHVIAHTLIKTGWRLYDPVERLVLDEFILNRNVTSEGKGINPAKAAEAIIGRKEAVVDASNMLGHEYAGRIVPYNIRVSRRYYVRGTENFKTGMRRARTGNWEGAAELWELEVSNRKRKVAGRACYNMAIMSEINGNLDSAIDWASRAYSDHKDRNALAYIRILRNRAAALEALNMQQGNDGN